MQEKTSHISIGVICLLVTGVFTFTRCSTDVDLTAEYKSIPIVFGLLDAEDDIQWVGINRTWLGEGDQTVAAMVQDSSEYAPERIPAQFVAVIGSVATRVFPLHDTPLETKAENGSFFAPEHIAYFARTTNNNGTKLDADAEYRFELVIDDTTEVEAITNMISVTLGNITQPPMGVDNIKLSFANVGSSNVTYPDYNFEWSSTPGAARYQATLVVHYVEHYWADDFQTTLDSSAAKQLEIPIGSVDPNDDDGGQIMNKSFPGQSFFSNLGSRLEKNVRITRELGIWDEENQISEAFDFVLTVANDELAIFLDINAPVTNIILERPEYSNINGGLGLWASRTTQGVYGLGYTTDTIEHLQEGDDTAELNFCTPTPWSDYACP